MDDTDRKLIMLIGEDPRMSVGELSRRIGLSRQAVNQRIQVLTDAGVFRNIKAGISANYTDGVMVRVWGKSQTAVVEKMLDRLGENELTRGAIVAGGNEIFVWGYLRSTADLSGFVEFVKSAANIPEPTVGIVCFGDGINPESYDGGIRKKHYKQLSDLDLKIIASLRDDARKPTAKIANEIGIAAKTVRRRLASMRADGSMDFFEGADLTLGEDTVTLINVSLKNGADKVKVAKRLILRDPLHLPIIRQFSDIPDLLTGWIYSDKMCETRRVLREISEDEDVMAVTPNFVYLERIYSCWDERLPGTLASPSPEAAKRDSSLGSERD